MFGQRCLGMYMQTCISMPGNGLMIHCQSVSCSVVTTPHVVVLLPFLIPSVIFFPIFYSHSHTQCNIPNARAMRFQHIHIALLMYCRSITYVFPIRSDAFHMFSNECADHCKAFSRRHASQFKCDAVSPHWFRRLEAFQRIYNALPGVA